MDQETERMVREIEGYLAAHPQASDSLEGVAGWWLRGQDHDASIETVRTALNELVRRGVVEQHLLPDGQSVFVARR